ncbi:hypothetical protein RAL72_003412 [Vibrio alginolyticus]|nr:hypothetical protein [Vibrio alginolyticus]EHA1120570.1 hypothetical protein [Vibrio alginolyticus]ELA7190161.1 hypothetical protein [Vibrio alginolyticus]
MKNKIFPLIALIFTSSVLAGDEQYTNKKWLPFGSSAAIVLPKSDNADDSRFYGLVVDCLPSKGTYRVSVKDIYSENGDVIKWETDKDSGTIYNQSALVIRTKAKDIQKNNEIVNALVRGNWVKFTNMSNHSSATYTLKGASSAINGISTCR